MNNSTLVFLINDDVRAITVEYEPDGTTGTFKTLHQTVKPDDFVIVETGTRHGFTVAKVKEVDIELDHDTGQQINWCLGPIDLDAHDAVLDQEKAAIAAVQSAEKRRRREELKAALFKDNEEKLKTLALASDATEVTEEE